MIDTRPAARAAVTPFARFAAILLATIGGGAVLANDPQYLVEYRAYNEALGRGDDAAAEAHAHAAWQAAEEALGDDRLTAILAFNFARQALFADSQRAITAIRRANDLRAVAAGGLPEPAVELYLAYLELVTGENSRRNAQALRDSLEGFAGSDDDMGFEIAAITLALAVMDFSAERLREAVKSATSAEAAIRRARLNDTVSLATAGIIKGAALLQQRPRREARIRDAQAEFRKVADLYPLQKDIDTFASGLAQALAWEFAATSLLQSMGERIGKADQWNVPTLFERAADPDLRCGEIEWASRKAPKYPAAALRKGYIGAVMVGFHIDDDMRVEDAKILAEIPADQFGDAVLEAVSSWEVASLGDSPPGCRRNRVTRIRFSID